ncbi:UDP-3-O-(3-hydroxymyristoyl)glucosamine N-acyltransferase [candidate division KSB1 bacterium]|nr:UDP-3-O-(3-hydroxymyristoyl)glucosamine N-acyltransferase [candidate division KSB1 bacterium]
MELKITEVAHLVSGDLEGDSSLTITGIAKIDEASDGQISFISNPKYEKYIKTTNASAVLVSKDFPKTDKTIIRTENPYISFLKILTTFHPQQETLEPGIHESAVVDSSSSVGKDTAVGPNAAIGKRCKVGKNCRIHPGVVISDDVSIGDNVVLYPNATIRERVIIGNNVIIHNGTVLGSDGFGFAREGAMYHKIPQVGTVVIEDDVEIGSNCTIDRATMGETRIKRGAKLDNLIQVAHNVVIGENTVIAAQTGVSGSTKVGSNVVIGGQVGFVGHITIGDNTQIGAQSGVSKDLPSDAVFFGYPARPIMQAKREEAAIRKLPDLLKRISKLEKQLKDR